MSTDEVKFEIKSSNHYQRCSAQKKKISAQIVGCETFVPKSSVLPTNFCTKIRKVKITSKFCSRKLSENKIKIEYKQV